jgi:putative tryptophan/tyrosine transport system substrate-binding protein
MLASGSLRMTIIRSALAAAIAVVLIAGPLVAAAQPPGQVSRVGVLLSGPPERQSLELDAFMKQLAELGWVQGQNLAMDLRWTEVPDTLRSTAAELLRAGVAVVLTAGPEATQAATRATSTTPIVMIGSTDPRTMGAGSLARPGGNLTGLTIGEPQVVNEKRLQLLKEAIPSIARVAVLYDVTRVPRSQAQMDVAARFLGLQLWHVDINDVADFNAAFKTARTRRADAVLLVEGPRAVVNRALIARLALENRLPVMSQFSRIVEAGGLLSYGPSLTDLFQQAAFYVDKILKGAKAADLPIEQPRKYELVINMKTAKSLGVTVPQSLRLRADQVIE